MTAQTHHEFDLRSSNTMGIAAVARPLIEVLDVADLPNVFDVFNGVTPLVLGSGSNIVFAADPSMPVLRLRNEELVWREDGDDVYVQVGAGLNWHAFVMDTVARGLWGIENLAYIPGTVGACPIQNIGAYGVEVKDAVLNVTVFEVATGSFHTFSNADCDFSYRESMFKRDLTKYVITNVEFRLSKQPKPQLSYAGLSEVLNDDGTLTSKQVADAVIAIRQSKLPDPVVLGNAGSFFKNPIVPLQVAEALAAQYEKMPVFKGSSDATRKLSAAWLIDQAGWKGHREGDAGVSPGHALVLVNYGNATGADIMNLAHKITASVHDKFNITIEPEPRVVG